VETLSCKLRPATSADGPAVREVVFAVLREYGLTPDPDGADQDLADLEGHYSGEGGAFAVLEDGVGRIVGSVGLKPVGTGAVELRKM